MKKEEIFEIIDKFNSSNLSKLKLSKNNFELELKKECTNNFPTNVTSENYTQDLNSFNNTNIIEEENTSTNNFLLKSPLVATFYEASSPESKPFIKEGDIVKEGDILFILEAMKMINEIKSPVSGKIINIFPKNGELVEYNQVILEIEEI